MSSLLIKGMKKPTACYRCQLRTGKYCGILTENEKCADDGVLPRCPITEVPEPHGRLIDADELFLEFQTDEQMRLGENLQYVRKTIEDAPTVIEAEEEE